MEFGLSWRRDKTSSGSFAPKETEFLLPFVAFMLKLASGRLNFQLEIVVNRLHRKWRVCTLLRCDSVQLARSFMKFGSDVITWRLGQVSDQQEGSRILWMSIIFCQTARGHVAKCIPLHSDRRENLKSSFTKNVFWLRHYATSQKVAASIPDEVIAFFNWP
jgi:hypothetical protein